MRLTQGEIPGALAWWAEELMSTLQRGKPLEQTDCGDRYMARGSGSPHDKWRGFDGPTV